MSEIKGAVIGRKKARECVSDEDFIKQMKAFLESYRICQKICDSYKEEYDAGIIPICEAEDRERVYRACKKRCAQVKEFIGSLSIELEQKKMLELHYLQGYTVERCADQLYLSRSTAFRVKKRAEISACSFYFDFRAKAGGDKEGAYGPGSSLKMA